MTVLFDYFLVLGFAFGLAAGLFLALKAIKLV